MRDGGGSNHANAMRAQQAAPLRMVVFSGQGLTSRDAWPDGLVRITLKKP